MAFFFFFPEIGICIDIQFFQVKSLFEKFKKSTGPILFYSLTESAWCLGLEKICFNVCPFKNLNFEKY